jgi:hypothetical protein
MEWHTGVLRRRSEWETGQAGITSSAGGLAGLWDPIVVLTTTPRWKQGGDNGALVVAGQTPGKLIADYHRLGTTEAFLADLGADVGIPTSELFLVRMG